MHKDWCNKSDAIRLMQQRLMRWDWCIKFDFKAQKSDVKTQNSYLKTQKWVLKSEFWVLKLLGVCFEIDLPARSLYLH